MPKDDLVRMTCNFCGYSDTFNIRDKAEIVLPIISKWWGVMKGDAPPNGGADSHDWYDSIECMTAGSKQKERREAEAIENQQKMDAALAKADSELKASPYCAPKAN